MGNSNSAAASRHGRPHTIPRSGRGPAATGIHRATAQLCQLRLNVGRPGLPSCLGQRSPCGEMRIARHLPGAIRSPASSESGGEARREGGCQGPSLAHICTWVGPGMSYGLGLEVHRSLL